MIELLEREISKNGCKFRVVPAERLAGLKAEIERFAASEELNGFQKHIVQKMYQYDTRKAGFPVRSVIILAAPAPAYAKVEFMWRGGKIPVVSLARATIGGKPAPGAMLGRLKKLLAPAGYHISPAPALPLKRLAARSGLARYGRNNIAYVEGLGSFLNLAAFYTDIPCNQDDWVELRVADRCAGCRVCIDSCPTNAIRHDRFLIDNERCLSFFNEGPGEFPGWIPLSAHHCVYDCLKCQIGCPMNREHAGNAAGPFVFSEEETSLLLSGRKLRELEPALRKKLTILGMDRWLAAIPRNLKILFGQAGARIE